MKNKKPQSAAEQLGSKADLVETPFFSEVLRHSRLSAHSIAPKLMEILSQSKANEEQADIEKRAEFLIQLQSELILFAVTISDAYTRDEFVAKRIAQKRGKDSGIKRGKISVKSKVLDFAKKEWANHPARTKNAIAKEYLKLQPDAAYATVRRYLNVMTKPG